MLYKTIDLCAGIGGIRRGFELAGDFENIISAEIDELACITYEHLFNENPKNDLTSEEFQKEITKKQYDILMAGFPCQAFSSVGQKLGFEDITRGTVFFEIAKIIKNTIPKVVFLENVENLVIHDKGNTFKTIIKTLDEELDYEIVGFPHGEYDNLEKYSRSFIRNSKFFGLPQNRPRVYIIAFSRAYFGKHVSSLPDAMPKKRERPAIFSQLKQVLEKDVPARFFLSSGYLQTLENHIIRQKSKGNGFGYRIVNSPEINNPIANTLLATGGSGKERNLIYDQKNGKKYAGTMVKGKQSPINDKYIRVMTPTEWGRLQGFVGYAFKDAEGNEKFSFPRNISITQQYKQLGNSVTIPVIEEMALFIKDCLSVMEGNFDDSEKRLYSMYGDELRLCKKIEAKLSSRLHKKTLYKYFDVVHHFAGRTSFSKQEMAELLGCTEARTLQILNQLISVECIRKTENKRYCFI
ncbi:MAG: DNA (cytosine-5-)-methyltransferase [Clostridia bacterium]|jgi:DNA (cytosine-5)-methyltransferase 1